MALADRTINKILVRTREEEDRDILQFRNELSLAKTVKVKEEDVAVKQILVTNALFALHDREIDLVIFKQRHNEDSNILKFRQQRQPRSMRTGRIENTIWRQEERYLNSIGRLTYR